MRHLIEFRTNVFREDWYPKIERGVIHVWDQFTDADKCFRALYGVNGNPTVRLMETNETDEQLKARAR